MCKRERIAREADAVLKCRDKVAAKRERGCNDYPDEPEMFQAQGPLLLTISRIPLESEELDL